MSQMDSLNFDDKLASNDEDSIKSCDDKEDPDDVQELNASDSTTGPDPEAGSKKKSTHAVSDDDITVESVVNNTENPRSSLTSNGRNSGHRSSSFKNATTKSVHHSGRIPRELIFQKLEGVQVASDALADRMDRVDTKIDQLTEGVTSLLDVNETLKDVISARITDVGVKVKALDDQVLRANSIRHEAKLHIMEVKMDKLEMLLSNLCDDVTKTRRAMEASIEMRSFLQDLDAKVDRIKLMMQAESSRSFESALKLSRALPLDLEPVSSVTSCESLSGLNGNDEPSGEAGPSGLRKRLRKPSNATAPKPDKESKLDNAHQIQYTKSAQTEDLNAKFTFACRHGLGTSAEVGQPISFDRQCRFQANILSHMKSHRSSSSHGDFLRDGTPSEASFSKTSDGQYMCTKRSLKNKECGKLNKSLSQHNRHSRSVLHRDDLIILNLLCKPCGSSFKNESLLLDHVGKSKCFKAKGVYGKDSVDPDAQGITCPTCGTQGFRNSSAVLQHQKSNDCVPKEDDDDDT